MSPIVRLGAGLIGITAGGLGVYGAWEYAYKLEGAITYLAIGAPVIACAAALIPPMAETLWRSGQRVKAGLWWLALVLPAAFVWFSAAERVHHAKAGPEAQREALRSAAQKAEANVVKAEAALAKATAAANRARALSPRQCGLECRTALEAEKAAQTVLAVAKTDALQAASKATAEAPYSAPVWLLPTALDVVAFLAIWTAFAPSKAKPAAEEPTKRQAKRKRRRRGKAKAKPVSPPRLRVVPSNDNAASA